jgi:putative methyltransferase (TIGR04325 family)
LTARDFVRAWAPPALLRAAHGVRGRLLRFSGDHLHWNDALAASSGYASSAILDRVVSATRAVVSGQAAYERDGVLFKHGEPPFAVLSALLRAAALQQGRLRVFDYGGSLGTTYRQCRPLLDGLVHVDWTVVEQAAFVAAAREFATEELHFVNALNELPPASQPAVLLGSGVLQYLENPSAVLAEISALPAIEHLVIDRTPMGEQQQDRLCVQHVPKQIYDASYPCWIFSRRRLLTAMGEKWRVVCEFLATDGTASTTDGMPFEFRGIVLERRK